MFKKLKAKLGEGVSNLPTKSNSPAETLPASASTTSNRRPSDVPASRPLRVHHEEPATGSLIQIDTEVASPDTSMYVTPDTSFSDVTLNGAERNLSRASSVSSLTSEPLFSPGPAHSLTLPSDVESEVDDSFTTALQFNAVSKDQMYQSLLKWQKRTERYKTKYQQVLGVYKELEGECEKLRTNMATSQDKAFRRISELKEQANLDAMAKRDLEQNYSLLIEEKDELLKVLKTQIALLKEGGEFSPAMRDELVAAVAKQESGGAATPSPPADAPIENTQALKDKIKRLESLLSKCKETIKGNKERTAQLTGEREALARQLADRDGDMERAREAAARTASQMAEARALIEQLEMDRAMAVAEAKQSMHAALEEKEGELEVARRAGNQLQHAAQSAMAEAGSLKQQLQDRADQLAESQQQLSTMQQLASEKAAQLLECEQKLEQMQQLAADKASQLAESQQELDNTTVQLADSRQQLLQTQQLVSEKAQQLAESQQQLQLACEERVLQTTAAVGEKEERLGNLMEQLHALNNQVGELRKKNSELEEDLKVKALQHEAKVTALAAANDSCAKLEEEQRKAVEQAEIMQQGLLDRVREVTKDTEQLQEQITSLTAENAQLRGECDTADARVHAQDDVMSGLRAQVAGLETVESDLGAQMERTQAECERRVEEASATSQAQVTQLGAALSEQQTQLADIVTELTAARRDGAEATAAVSRELEACGCALREREAEVASLAAVCRDLEDRSAQLEEELTDKMEQARSMQSELVAATSRLNYAESRVTELEGQVTSWQAAAQESAGGASATTELLQQLQREAAATREQLQLDKAQLEQDLLRANNTASDLEVKISGLEQAALEREEVITCLTAQLAEHGAAAARLVTQLEDSAAQLQRRREEFEELTSRLTDVTTQLAAARNDLTAKDAELEAKDSKFSQLKDEAKAKIKDVKAQMDTLRGEKITAEKNLQEKLSGTELAMDEERREERERHYIETEALKLDYQAEIKVLSEKLEGERLSMTSFKQTIQAQQRKQQDQVKETIHDLKSRFSESLQDKDDISKKQLEKQAKAFDREKAAAAKQATLALQQAQAEMENLKAQHEAKLAEITSSHEHSLESLTADCQTVQAELESDKSHRAEEQMSRDHHQEIQDLHADLHDKDQRTDQMCEDYDVQLQLKDEERDAAVRELRAEIEQLKMSLQQQSEQFAAERQTLEASVKAGGRADEEPEGEATRM